MTITIYSAPTHETPPRLIAYSMGRKAMVKKAPALCPDCGGPLETVQEQIREIAGFHFCRHCRILWDPSGKAAKQAVLFSDAAFSQVMRDWHKYQTMFRGGRPVITLAAPPPPADGPEENPTLFNFLDEG